jgi:nitrogen regulatory protein PII-like uncharacterized protein
MLEDTIINVLANYGIAGIILYVFYKLFTNELENLRESIEKLSDAIEKNNILISTLIEKLKER